MTLPVDPEGLALQTIDSDSEEEIFNRVLAETR